MRNNRRCWPVCAQITGQTACLTGAHQRGASKRAAEAFRCKPVCVRQKLEWQACRERTHACSPCIESDARRACKAAPL